MEFSLSLGYFLFLLSVIITTLGLIALGGILKNSFKTRRRPRLKKKLLFFPVFVVGLILIGWISERLQAGIFVYLQENAAASLSGLILAILIAWVLYDYVFWRKR